jgi:hypothetical protein
MYLSCFNVQREVRDTGECGHDFGNSSILLYRLKPRGLVPKIGIRWAYKIQVCLDGFSWFHGSGLHFTSEFEIHMTRACRSWRSRGPIKITLDRSVACARMSQENKVRRVILRQTRNRNIVFGFWDFFKILPWCL